MSWLLPRVAGRGCGPAVLAIAGDEMPVIARTGGGQDVLVADLGDAVGFMTGQG